MLWIEIQYAKTLGSQLDGFKVASNNPFVANFRCPLCGDSHKNKRLKRGYLYQRSQHIYFYCHNCAASLSLSRLIERMNPELYHQMRLELFRGGSLDHLSNDDRLHTDDIVERLKTVHKANPGNSILDYLSPASHHETAIAYMSERKIPHEFWSSIYFTSNFPDFVEKAFNGKLISEPPCHRLVIPFNAPRGNEIVGVSARVIPSTESVLNRRYYSLVKPGYLKLWQSPSLDINKIVYVTEGIIDAFFVANSAAMLGSDVSTAALRCLYNDFAYVFDNEPRNKQIVSRIQSKINDGCKVVIWPSDNPHKDVNEMVLNGVPLHLANNTKQGLAADMALNAWKKV